MPGDERRLEAVDLPILLEGGGDHPVEGHQGPHEQDDEQAVAHPLEQAPGPYHRRHSLSPPALGASAGSAG